MFKKLSPQQIRQSSNTLLFIGAWAFVFAVFTGVPELIFLLQSQKTTGTVTEITRENQICSGQVFGSSSHECTILFAQVSFKNLQGIFQSGAFEIGRATGHNRTEMTVGPTYTPGQSVDIRHRQSQPVEVKLDNFRALFLSTEVYLASALAILTVSCFLRWCRG